VQVTQFDFTITRYNSPVYGFLLISTKRSKCFSANGLFGAVFCQKHGRLTINETTY